jgi:HAD superfamily hydrolase (TIGR01509 family)
MPGALELLKNLKKKNFVLAIATSSPQEVLNFVLEKLDIRKFFKVVISGDLVRRGKPDPEIYLLTVRKLGVDPKDCVVLEDSVNGVQAANNAGMKSIGVVNKYADRDDLAEADMLVDSLSEVGIEDLD